MLKFSPLLKYVAVHAEFESKFCFALNLQKIHGRREERIPLNFTNDGDIESILVQPLKLPEVVHAC